MDEKVQDYLTLGDGDFTYSYDLCRFIQAQTSLASSLGQQSSTSKGKVINVTCSGIDPLLELQNKYKDVDSLLRKMNRLSGNVPMVFKTLPSHTSSDEHLSKKPKIENDAPPIELRISIHHSVNAIFPWSADQTDPELVPSPKLPNCRYKNVIFNHPHIGNEDAQLHSRFLSHFFHSVDQHWLATGGTLFLTLVKGQFERWNTAQAAKMNGLEVVYRDSFKAPPAPYKYIQYICREQKIEAKLEHFQSKHDKKCKYQLRRHQSGKSFSNRAKDGSETISFRRIKDANLSPLGEKHLPWQLLDLEEDEDTFLCQICNKSFRDERARKNHIKCVHDAESKANIETFTCTLCEVDRTFRNKEALEAHQKAKHSGPHTSIKPEWAACVSLTPQAVDTSKPVVKEVIGKCGICDLEFKTDMCKTRHYNDFIPKFSIVEKEDQKAKDVVFECSTCRKCFKDLRALKQHENFCSP